MTQRLPETAGGAPVDWRGLCGELLRELENAIAVHYGEGGTHHISAADAVIAKADAAMAQPEPEVVGPTDEEWDALVNRLWDQYETIGYQGERFMYEGDFSTALDLVRQKIARWGRPAPAPAEGEVGELVDALRADAECAEVEHYDLCNMTADQMRRAADLLERQAVTEESSATAPAQATAGEVGELVALIRQIAMAWAPDTCLLGNMTAGQLTRAAELLEQHQVAPVPVALTEPIAAPVGGNYREAWDMSSKNGSLCFASAILSRLVGMDAADQADLQWLAAYLQANSTPQPVPVPVASDTRYEFSVYDEDYTEQAGGTAPTYAQALSEGQHYLAQYQQDGPHTLEVRRVEVLHPDALPVLPEGVHVIEPTKHTILVPAPVPVAVSERWPEGRDLGPDGAIWFRHTDKYGETHWLPDVLPLPGGEVK